MKYIYIFNFIIFIKKIQCDPYPLNYCRNGCQIMNTDIEKSYFMCPHLLLGSDEMIEASKKDGNEWSYYALATHYNSVYGCGRCFQLEYQPYCGNQWNNLTCNGYACQESQLPFYCIGESDCENCKEISSEYKENSTYCKGMNCNREDGCDLYPKKQLIIQTFNIGIECDEGQFDIYMILGGVGAYPDGCKQIYPNGNWDENKFGGGYITKNYCKNAPKEYREMCEKIWELKYHGNWIVYYEEIKCPDTFTELTGFRLKNREKGINGQLLNEPNEKLFENKENKKIGFTSTMMDCCKPACSYPWVKDEIKYKTDNDIDDRLKNFWMCDINKQMINDTEELYIIENGIKNFC